MHGELSSVEVFRTPPGSDLRDALERTAQRHGCVVAGSSEIALGWLDGIGLTRIHDRATGSRELVVRPKRGR